MSNRDVLLATARANAKTALATSIAASMTQLKSDLNSDPSTTIKQPEVTAAANLIGQGQNVKLGITTKTASDFIEAFR